MITETKEKAAKPFLKWVGGKSQLIPEIDIRLPKDLSKREYYEPFIGGGAVFFHILNKFPDIKKISISDSNRDLIDCYIAIKNKPDLVIGCLKALENDYLMLNSIDREKYFYSKRYEFNKEKNQGWHSFKKVSLFIFLNKTCFNGLYRVNKSGGFNSPFGWYDEPLICHAENILLISKVLQKVDIICQDFREIKVNKNSFIYLDPPYDKVSNTSNFTSYTKEKFDAMEQMSVSAFVKHLDNEKCKFLVSNSDTGYIRNLYSSFQIESVQARRSVNCKGGKRGKVSEVLIKNYKK